jgi:hypothetical protein
MTKKGHRGGAHFGCAGCEPGKIRHRWGMGDGESRAEGWVKRGRDGVTAVARARGSSPRVGIGSPSARGLMGEGEGGDDLYIAQRGRCVSLLLFGGKAELGGRWFDITLPILAGEHRAATVGCRRGEPRRTEYLGYLLLGGI